LTAVLWVDEKVVEKVVEMVVEMVLLKVDA